jgi:hypothetical protein
MTSVPPVALDEPLDGQAEYREALREQARQVAALVVHLRVKLSNRNNAAQIALGTGQAVPLPSLEPNVGSDASLAAFITSRHENPIRDEKRREIAPKLSAGTLEELTTEELEQQVIKPLEQIVERLGTQGIKVGD